MPSRNCLFKHQSIIQCTTLKYVNPFYLRKSLVKEWVYFYEQGPPWITRMFSLFRLILNLTDFQCKDCAFCMTNFVKNMLFLVSPIVWVGGLTTFGAHIVLIGIPAISREWGIGSYPARGSKSGVVGPNLFAVVHLHSGLRRRFRILGVPRLRLKNNYWDRQTGRQTDRQTLYRLSNMHCF